MIRFRHRSSGQILVLTSLMMIAIIGFAALAVDIGFLYTSRRRMQTAADAAAITGATALRDGQSVNSAAKTGSSLNGFTDGQNSVTVTVNNPPSSGTYAGNSAYVEVIVKQPQPTFFLRVLGFTTLNVNTRAVSGAIDGPACIYVLDPSASDALYMQNGAKVTSSCAVLVDSSSSSAIHLDNNASITASSVGVAGDYLVGGGSTISPTPVTGVAPVADPLAGLAAPAIGACTANQLQISGGTTTLNPGTYCGGLSIDGATVTFNPGTYVIIGHGFTVQNGSKLNGTGVTLFIGKDSGGNDAPIQIDNSNTLTLSAPTSGPYKGILFYRDRKATDLSKNIINDSTSSILDGVLYFPTTPLAYNGSSSGSGYTEIIANTLEMDNYSSITMGNNYSSLQGGSPIKSDALYE